MTNLCGALALVLCAASGVSSQAQVQAPDERRVLFIGNSLTAANGLPAMLEALASLTQPPVRITTRLVAFPDFSLEDHWNDGRAVRAIRDGSWTHVVLQQGPSSLPESQLLLREYTKRFHGEIRKKGAQTVLYGVWPPKARAAFFDAVSRAYRQAADDVGGVFVPAGDALRAAERLDARLPLFERDGFHPSPVGTYVAAMVFLQRLTGIASEQLPIGAASSSGALRPVRITAEQAEVIRAAIAAR